MPEGERETEFNAIGAHAFVPLPLRELGPQSARRGEVPPTTPVSGAPPAVSAPHSTGNGAADRIYNTNFFSHPKWPIN